MNKESSKIRSNNTLFWLILILFPLLTSAAALLAGRFWIAPGDLIGSILSKLGGSYIPSLQTEQVLWNLRFPRILLALLVGGGLSAAGCACQSLFANPLATPDTLGVASGASLGAALGILWGLQAWGIQLTALAAGLMAVLLTYLAGSSRDQGLGRLILAGIMIGSLFNALISLVKYLADTESQLPTITYWLMGSLNGKSYDSLALGAPLILAGIILLILLRWRLNLLPLPEDQATATGVNIKFLRITTILCATAITASCVSMCGQVGWVGLLIPHICRMLWGGNHLRLLPASISLGAGFMVIVDTLARSISPADIPVSILTAIIGAPFFILLMRRSEGWQL